MRRWVFLAEVDEHGSYTGSLDEPDANLERLAAFTSTNDEPTDDELADVLEGYDGEYLLLPLDAGRVIVAKTTTSVDVTVERTGVYS